MIGSPYFLDIAEEVEEGTLVFHGRDYFQSLGQPPVAMYAQFQDSNLERVFKKHFSYESFIESEATAGIFTTKGDFDREVMADDLRNTFAPVVFNFTLINLESPSLEIIGCLEVGIHVLDADDNSPNFPTEEISVEFNDDNEGVDHARLLHPLAEDGDEGLNGIRHYNLTDDLGIFYLDVREDDVTHEITTVYLKNSVPLDREMRECYNLSLVASEGRADGETATVPIRACVMDRCDEAPYFVVSHYQPSLPENSQINTTIANVTAYDDDLGSGGRVQYLIDRVCTMSSPQSSCRTLSKPYPFHLDMESGELILDSELDRETDPQFMVTVKAEDGCDGTATATVVITLEDVNDNPPEVTYSAADFDRNLRIQDVPESFSVPSDLGHFDVTDPDLGDNGTVMVHLYEVDESSGEISESQKFSIADNTLKLIGELDHDTVSKYTLMIIAHDMGLTPLMSNYTFTIEVVDVNDNPPRFLPIQPEFELFENASMNHQVVELRTDDADSGENGRVSYELPPSNSEFPHQELFIVDNAGVLKVNGMLDRETQDKLRVLVVATDNPTNRESFNDTIVVNITLLDVNDNPPEIISLNSFVNISEARKPDYIIATVVAQDIDTEVHATLMYFLAPDSGPFEIDSQGVIRLISKLDFEESPKHSLTLCVSDGVHNTTQTITVHVEDVNDEPPVISLNGPLVVTLPENQEPGQLVAQIEASDKDTPPEQLVFTIVDGNQNDFRIESTGTGDIYTRVRLNRELVSQYSLFVQVSDGLHFSLAYAQVDVIVRDENDNPPEFTGLPFLFTVVENAPAGRLVGETRAEDPDEGQNGEIQYNITGGNDLGLFYIDPASGEITTTQVLNREELPGVFQLNIQISDQGVPPQFGASVVATVTILDENDNGPRFSNSEVAIELREDLGTGHIFLTVEADDPDISPNNRTTYSIIVSQTAPTEDLTFFYIDPETGHLSLQQTLDYETKMSHEFVVLAEDNETVDPQRQDSITVRITVINTVDPILAFEESFPLSFQLGEDARTGDTLYVFSVMDKNTGNPVLSELQYTLTNQDGSESQQFGISYIDAEAQARIYTLALDLDRENPTIPDVYLLNVTVRDIRPLNAPDSYGSLSHGFTVTIKDINDNHPMFSEPFYVFSINENRGTNEFIGTVHADDPDQGENQTVVYRIRESVPFSIDPSNGQITVLQSLDYEVKSEYIFYVVAEDQGVRSLTSEVSVTVNVNDLNDNFPMFDQIRNFVVPEDSVIGTTVATIGVTDLDSGSFGEVDITVAPGSRLDSHFALRTTGDIILVAPLDYDTGDVLYSFEARARDGGTPWKETREQINITVGDVNDNRPAYVNTTFSVTIPEDYRHGVDFTSLVANDVDSGVNGEVWYELADASLSYIFSVHPTTGKIFITPQSPDDYPPGPFPPVIDYERTQSYDVEIIAYDRGIPRNNDTKTLRVTIENVNEFHPVFDRGSVTVYVDEGLPQGTRVISLQAYDWDYDLLEYSLPLDQQVPYAHFGWDSASRSIVTIRELDYSLSHNYYLELHATESVSRHNSTITVHIVVVNVNDHSPEFSDNSVSLAISEETAPGKVVFTANATDQDNSTNDAVTYYFSQESGNDSNSFSIDLMTGEISVSAPLDYEHQSEFTLFVLATDTGKEPRTSPTALIVTISLQNTNDERPIFSDPEYTFQVSENRDPGTLVGEVLAVDRDVGVYGSVLYSLTGSSEYFTIDAKTGQIFTQANIDREILDVSTLVLTVTASDEGQPAKTATVLVNIVITDQNDNPPRFSESIYLFSLLPDQESDVVFATLEASDMDEGENAEFTYEITSQDDGISVAVSQDGGLSLQPPGIPQSYQTVYSLRVRVTDSPSGTMFDEALVHLLIEVEGDHHPQFTEHFYEVTVREDAQSGMIFDISDFVSDNDPGQNGILEYGLDSGDLSTTFSVNENTGVVTLAAQLDFETTARYELTVYATDTTPDHPRTASATLVVLVEDVNDWDPLYIDPVTAITISTTTFTNIELFTVHAEDQDSGDSGTVGYSIDNSQPLFEVNPVTGVVTNKGPLTQVGEVSFVIRAFDRGMPLRSSDINVVVTVRDPGSMAPGFSHSSPLAITIPENEDYPSTIQDFATVQPADSFHIVYTNATPGTFSVSQNTGGGRLTLESELNYEVDSKYIVIIEARTGSFGDRYSSFLEVEINVDDVNDNPPIFSHIGVQMVSEAQEVDVPLFTVSAADADHGSLGEITYEIVSGNNAKIFKLDPNSGEMSLSRSLDREEREDGGRYELEVRASDGGVSDTQRSQITVVVEVVDDNDYPPHFEYSSYEISIYESPHSAVGDRLIRLTAIDLDSGPPVRYDLLPLQASHGMTLRPVDHITAFGINVDTGVITVEETLDRETTDYYLFNVTATDTVSTAWTLLHVKVLDVNEHDPVIVYNAGELVINELLPVGSLVTDKISASDADSGPNGGIVFSLGEGWLPEDHFEIHPQTGVIRIKEQIRYSQEESHFVGVVIASDLGVPQRTATTEITVVVRDVNDHPPEFTPSSYDISVAIDTRQNSVIFKFNATDQDHGFNHGIMYRLPTYYSQARELFIMQADGTMLLRKDEDQGLLPGTYHFKVEAANRNPYPFAPQYHLASYADVSVTILPVNREKPVFSQDEYSTSILEDFTVSEIVPGLNIFALDADGDGILYSIDSPTGSPLPFSIDQDTGNVTLTSELNREEKDLYEFLVVATDTGFPPESTTVPVTIEIGDVNDESPTFNASHYIGSVQEASVLGKFVLQVFAIDRDLNDGGQVAYAIDSSYASFPFEIDPNSGNITVAGDINYEGEVRTYRFYVTASDMGATPYSSSVEVTVNVLGVNEFNPQFVDKTYNFVVSANAQVGDVVGMVVAVDEDGGEQGQLMYSFSNKAPEDYFSIETVDGMGVITLTVNPERSASLDEPQKRAVPEVDEGFFLVPAEIVATDGGGRMGEATAYIQLHNSFAMVVAVPTTESTSAPPFQIIAIVVGVVVVVVVAFVAVLVAACICRMKRKKSKVQITDAMNNDLELQQRFSSSRASGSYSGTPSTSQLRHHVTNTSTSSAYPDPNVLNHSPSGSDSSRHSYAGYAGDDDSLNGEGNTARYSPSLPRKSPGTRSTTSDLASTVGTEMLTNASQEAPYPKAQIMAIYAANQELLDNDGSQDSVHMFELEGGGEADGALDIDTILLSKYPDIDDEDSTTMAEDDASILEKEQSMVTDSSSHLNIRPMEEHEDPFQYSQSMHQRSWMPRSSSITHTIDQLVNYADSQEDPEPMHGRQMYQGGYEHSQATSLYGGPLSQGSHMPLLSHQQQKPLPDDYPYYGDHFSQDSHHHLHHLPPRSRRFTSSATALSGEHLSDHRSMDHAPLPRHLRYSQEMPPHPSYHHGHLRYIAGRPHTPASSTTPTEGTITPNTALAPDYDHAPVYLSSSSSASLASTNISQPIPRGQRFYHPHHHH